ncbi:MAG: hypothetical protein J6D37_06195 [Clostridia bacterium]|nr:hypothetical protein [Clostridia bacterium]
MEQSLQHNLTLLAEKAYGSNLPRYSDFLSVSELEQYEKMKGELSFASPRAFGGYEGAERKVVGFLAEAFPIVCLKIEPVNRKFSDELSHRDFLGSVLGLGLERSVIGDIVVKDRTGYLFCLSRMADYIRENLKAVSRTSVTVSVWEGEVDSLVEREKVTVSVSSLRVDCVVSAVLHLSRGDAERMAKCGLILVNGRPQEGDKKVREGDVFAVRGKGKFVFLGEEGKSRKERIFIAAELYR